MLSWTATVSLSHFHDAPVNSTCNMSMHSCWHWIGGLHLIIQAVLSGLRARGPIRKHWVGGIPWERNWLISLRDCQGKMGFRKLSKSSPFDGHIGKPAAAVSDLIRKYWASSVDCPICRHLTAILENRWLYWIQYKKIREFHRLSNLLPFDVQIHGRTIAV